MTNNEFFKHIASGAKIVTGSEAHQVMHRLSQEALKLTVEINSAYHEPRELRQLMSQLTGRQLDEHFGLFPPFHTDCGKNITIGRRVFINMGCTFQDWGRITIGDDCLIGHNCTICTVNHDKKTDARGDMTCRPVIIGDKVWIGANVTILPGVTIGSGAIIAAGAVVTRDVAPRSVVAGIPASPLSRNISAT